jgi:hypothetical protein
MKKIKTPLTKEQLEKLKAIEKTKQKAVDTGKIIKK